MRWLLRLAADVTGRVVGTAASYALNLLWPSDAFNAAADQLWADTNHQHRTQTQLDEIAEHLGAIRALLEDTRNMLAHSARGDVTSSYFPGPTT
jgi:hypothetical protein